MFQIVRYHVHKKDFVLGDLLVELDGINPLRPVLLDGELGHAEKGTIQLEMVFKPDSVNSPVKVDIAYVVVFDRLLFLCDNRHCNRKSKGVVSLAAPSTAAAAAPPSPTPVE